MADDTERGLYSKYRVTKADGKPLDGPCFVLRPDRDYAAWHALNSYGIYTTNDKLSTDIFAWLDEMGQPPYPDELRKGPSQGE